MFMQSLIHRQICIDYTLLEFLANDDEIQVYWNFRKGRGNRGTSLPTASVLCGNNSHILLLTHYKWGALTCCKPLIVFFWFFLFPLHRCNGLLCTARIAQNYNKQDNNRCKQWRNDSLDNVYADELHRPALVYMQLTIPFLVHKFCRADLSAGSCSLSYNSVDVWLILFLRSGLCLCVDTPVVSQYFKCLSGGRLTPKFSLLFFVVSNSFKPGLNHHLRENSRGYLNERSCFFWKQQRANISRKME